VGHHWETWQLPSRSPFTLKAILLSVIVPTLNPLGDIWQVALPVAH
jgi:hypothetical protein